MDEYKLTKRDYEHIKDLSHEEWLKAEGSPNLARIYIKVFCDWLMGKNLKVLKGRIIKDD